MTQFQQQQQATAGLAGGLGKPALGPTFVSPKYDGCCQYLGRITHGIWFEQRWFISFYLSESRSHFFYLSISRFRSLVADVSTPLMQSPSRQPRVTDEFRSRLSPTELQDLSTRVRQFFSSFPTCTESSLIYVCPLAGSV